MEIILLFINEDMGHDFTEYYYLNFVRSVIEGKYKWKEDFFFETIKEGAGHERTEHYYTICDSFKKYKYVYPIKVQLYETIKLIVQSLSFDNKKKK